VYEGIFEVKNKEDNMPDSLDFFKYYPDKNLKDFVYYKSLLVNNP